MSRHATPAAFQVDSSIGCERLCLHALRELGFPDFLTELGASSRDVAIAQALVMAHMGHPASERETSRWPRKHSSTPELLNWKGP